MIQTLCYLLEALLTPENTPPDTAKEIYEFYFVFAAVWAFGGSMFQDQVSISEVSGSGVGVFYALFFFNPLKITDYRIQFSKWWVSEFKTVKFPSQVTIAAV